MNKMKWLLLMQIFLFIVTGCNNSINGIVDEDKFICNSDNISGRELYWGIVNSTLYISATKTDNATTINTSALFSTNIDDIPWHISPYGERIMIKKIVIEKTGVRIVPISIAYWFADMINCDVIEGLENIDTSEVKNMSNLFHSCRWLSSLDLKSFNTSKVEDMSGMFQGCGVFSAIDLSTFDTSNVVNMSSMFELTKLDVLDLSSFDTSNVNNMSKMFANSQVVSLNLSSFNTKNVEDMSYMFSMCNRIKELDLSNFDTRKVTNMYCMFDTCSSIDYLNISTFDISNVSRIDCFFGNANDYVKSIDLGNLDFSKVADITNLDDLYRDHIPQ